MTGSICPLCGDNSIVIHWEFSSLLKPTKIYVGCGRDRTTHHTRITHTPGQVSADHSWAKLCFRLEKELADCAVFWSSVCLRLDSEGWRVTVNWGPWAFSEEEFLWRQCETIEEAIEFIKEAMDHFDNRRLERAKDVYLSGQVGEVRVTVADIMDSVADVGGKSKGYVLSFLRMAMTALGEAEGLLAEEEEGRVRKGISDEA